MLESKVNLFWKYFTGGIDQNLEGYGGAGCHEYRQSERIIYESVFLLVVISYLASHCLKTIRKDLRKVHVAMHDLMVGSRQLLLAVTAGVLGMQIGFKIVTQTTIYLFQPCHLTTCVQIYLLAAPSNQYTRLIYRLHAGFLNGGVLALIFPVLDTFTLPFEVELYYIQHYLILLIPMYLATQGDPFTLEPFTKFEYSLMSFCVFMYYHVVILQPLSFYSGVNLNFVMCPAPSDPFKGPHYILLGSWGQSVVMCSVSKVASIFTSALNPVVSTKSAENKLH